jgi:hypothetical protein
VYVLTVVMAAHLAAVEVTTSIPNYLQGQVAQAINRATFSIRPLQSKSIARRLYAAIGPLYRHWLEAHRKEIVSESKFSFTRGTENDRTRSCSRDDHIENQKSVRSGL